MSTSKRVQNKIIHFVVIFLLQNFICIHIVLVFAQKISHFKMRKLLVTILITNVIVLCMSASIIGECQTTVSFHFFTCSNSCLCILVDFLTNENESRQNAGENGQRNCICNGPQCMCCLDFNISFVDLGGPGNYFSENELN